MNELRQVSTLDSKIAGHDVTRDAMHEVHRWKASDSEGIEALIKLAAADSPKRHVDFLETARSLVEKISGELKLPDPFNICLVEGNSWRPLPKNWGTMTRIERAQAVTNGVAVEVGWSYIRRNSGPLSDAWFVGEVSMRVEALVHRPEDQRRDAALRLGFLMGQWSSRRHLTNVARGKKVKKAASKGGEERARAASESQRPILNAIRQYIDNGHSIRRASELAYKEELGTSTEANRKLWQRKGLHRASP